MTIRNTYAAEAWDKVYGAFQQINFTAYDYDTVKESLLQYLKIYHAEHFNDFIESSELVAILELFAYVAEQLAYRVDTMAHENFMTTAQRKQSILRLAKLVSYKASRNIPARGLVKITSIRTSESLFDSLGNNLANATVFWNDPNNTNWKEQFFLVVNKVLTTQYGQPIKAAQIGDVAMQLYTFNNQKNVFRNGVFAFMAAGANEQLQMEIVPSDIDEHGPFERAPDLAAQFNIIYANDGKGDGSDFTGFMMFAKQGSLIRTDYSIAEPIANRRIELDSINVNDTDVWVYRADDTDAIIEIWNKVDALSEQNLYFNNNKSRKKYEIETLENDRIALIFGDGNFSDAPKGNFQLWTRVSTNQNLFIPKNRIANQQMAFTYANQQNNINNCSLTFSLTAAIQNNAVSETVEQIRQSAPATYYSQNRMVNGQDYNTFMLKDPSVLRLKTINRTFAGQPKYIEWNDASRKYENVKLFGDDLTMFTDMSVDSMETAATSKVLIDSFIQPMLQTNGIFNALVNAISSTDGADGIISYPRRTFIEDNRPIYKQLDGTNVNPYATAITNLAEITGTLNEKSVIQGALDMHWYGDASSYATINGIRHAVISDPVLNPEDDGKIYQPELPRTIDGVNTYPPGDIGSGLQQVGSQAQFGLRFNPFLMCFGDGDIELFGITPVEISTTFGYGDTTTPEANGLNAYKSKKEVLTIEMTSDNVTFTVVSNLRGKLPNYVVDATNSTKWSVQAGLNLPTNFIIHMAGRAFEVGDGFVIDIEHDGTRFFSKVRKIQNTAYKANFTGWWELVPANILNVDVLNSVDLSGPNLEQQMSFNQNSVPSSWLFLIVRVTSGARTTGWRIFSRNLKTIVESKTTKFWHNTEQSILDSQTRNRVNDKIRILRSNLDEIGKPLPKADVYDVLGFAYNTDGSINFNRLEVAPTDTIDFIRSGDATPDNILQFSSFASGSYQYGRINADNQSVDWFNCGSGTPEFRFSTYQPESGISVEYAGSDYVFESDTAVGSPVSAGIDKIVRRRMVPTPIVDVFGQTACGAVTGLDFMWQHFSPVTNLVDPSVSNIHDAFIMSRGYHTSMLEYVKGFSDLEPQPPTPLELRTSYGYLLKNKMLSDTVVLHPGKIKLLFGSKADQRLRAKFRVVKAPLAVFSDERIKQEIVDVIDKYFDIQGWDFGDTFYATELISLIHQRLSNQIASVVIVPTYSVNSFGSLFTIESGLDEILQSAATVNDIEMVDALTPTVLRQIR